MIRSSHSAFASASTVARASAWAGVLAAATLTACSSSNSVAGNPSPVTPASTEAVQLVVPGVTLHGTLELPAGRAPFTVALIIAGSGPTDRNGNSPVIPGANNSLKMLADSLRAAGIASVRYDKRGVAQSIAPGMREDDLRFTTYSDDASAWVRQLRADPRFDRIVIIGHSEGAMLGTLAARTTNADGLVLLAGAGRPIGVVLREQMKVAAPAMYTVVDSLIGELEAGRALANVPPSLMSLFRPSVQPYMISWLPIDPATELGRIATPSLVLQGTTDVQTSVADAQRLAGASPRVRMVTLDGINHLLKRVSGTTADQAPTYGDPTIPVDGRVIAEILTYIRSLPPN